MKYKSLSSSDQRCPCNSSKCGIVYSAPLTKHGPVAFMSDPDRWSTYGKKIVLTRRLWVNQPLPRLGIRSASFRGVPLTFFLYIYCMNLYLLIFYAWLMNFAEGRCPLSMSPISLGFWTPYVRKFTLPPLVINMSAFWHTLSPSSLTCSIEGSNTSSKMFA